MLTPPVLGTRIQRADVVENLQGGPPGWGEGICGAQVVVNIRDVLGGSDLWVSGLPTDSLGITI